MTATPSHQFTTLCLGCRATLRIKTRQADKRVPCPKCGTVQTVRATLASPPPRPLPLPPPPPPATAEPPAHSLTPETVRGILAQVAGRTNADGILKLLHKGVNEKKARKAVESYGCELEDGEEPLLLVDDSFLRNGSAGLLLTSRRLFSSRCPAYVRLAEVTSADSERPSRVLPLALFLMSGALLYLLGMLVHRLSGGRPSAPRLRVNGRVVFEGKLNDHFWVQALYELGAAAGHAGGGAMLARQLADPRQLLRHTAAAVAAGLTDDEIDRTLATHTARPDEARDLRRKVRRIAARRPVGQPLLLMLCGTLAGMLGLFVTLASQSSSLWVIWFGPMIGGPMMALTGLYRLAVGTPMSFDTLFRKAGGRGE